MKKMLNFLILTFSILGGCTTPPPPNVSTPLVLKDVESLSVNKNTSDTVFSRFGKPSLTLASEKEGAFSWIYLLNGNSKDPRVSFVFDKKTQSLKNVNWFVYENDFESDPVKAMARYDHAHFKKHQVQWQIVDYIHTRVTLVDNKMGVAISTRDDRDDVVTLISFGRPSPKMERDGLVNAAKMRQQDDWKVITAKTDQRTPATPEF